MSSFCVVIFVCCFLISNSSSRVLPDRNVERRLMKECSKDLNLTLERETPKSNTVKLGVCFFERANLTEPDGSISADVLKIAMDNFGPASDPELKEKLDSIVEKCVKESKGDNDLLKFAEKYYDCASNEYKKLPTPVANRQTPVPPFTN